MGMTAEDAQGVYFPTDRVPVIMDLLTPFVAICREEGLRPFAWMVTRDARLGVSDLAPEFAYHPKSATLRPTPRLDILDPDVLEHLEGLFTDLARTGVAGILLQDDLSSRMVEGFTEGNLHRYREDTGDVVRPYLYLEQVTAEDGRPYLKAAPGFGRWVRWKTNRLVAVASHLQDVATAVFPGAVLLMNQMYEALTDPENGLLWLSQDMRTSLQDGPVYVSVMLYHRQMQEELDLALPEILEMVQESLDGLSDKVNHRHRIVLKFQTRDWRTGRPVPPEDLLSALMTAWGGDWSLVLVPPPTEEQLRIIGPVFKGM
jgi:biofilm PGA synthesis lipoprotein PgaB